ncbi:MAG: stage II sporulation protein R [Clostridiales bacterium]|nr:stage II sporulation protein R [Clostridiales bacterium]
MKTNKLYVKILSFVLSFCMIICLPIIILSCKENNTYSGELLRLHIRANSNSEPDQAVKLKVRDSINQYLAENITATSFAAAYAEIGLRLKKISDIADNVLQANGFYYGAKAELANEYFPTRVYGNVEVKEGFYDALIVKLGEGKGDNWWCVVYPPLCYGDKFEYKSIFAELFG